MWHEYLVVELIPVSVIKETTSSSSVWQSQFSLTCHDVTTNKQLSYCCFLDINSPVIKGLRFYKSKLYYLQKCSMVYSNALICLFFRRRKSLPKFLLGNYLKCVDLVVARQDISKHISMDHCFLTFR